MATTGEFTAKTVEEAIAKGLESLGIEKSQADIEILEEGKKKLFGSSPAKVKISKKKTDAQRAAEFVDGLLSRIGITGFCEIKNEQDSILIEVQTATSKALIGKRGEIIDAIQSMAGAIANIGREEYVKLTLDCDGYRDKRQATLIKLADKLAKKAYEKGRKLSLQPMNAYDRRIIHSALSSSEYVKTESEGVEPMRHVVIIPNNLRERPYGNRPNRGRGGYNQNRGGGQRGGYQGNNRGGQRRRSSGTGSRGTFNRDRRENEQYGREDRSQGGHDRPYSDRPYNDRPYNRDNRRPGQGGTRPPRGKKEIHFGTYLGNSKENETPKDDGENKE